MNILFLSPYAPYPPRSGGALRIYNLLRGLARRHEVCCLTFAADEAAEQALAPLHDICRVEVVQGVPRRSMLRRALTTVASPLPDMALRNASRAYTRALQQLLRGNYFDIVQAESIEMARYGRLALPYAHVVLDEFNAEYVLQRRAAFSDLRQMITRPRLVAAASYSFIQWRKLATYEQRLLRRYDRVLAVSEHDRRALRKLVSNARIAIVPNGVDTDYFSPQFEAVPDEDTPDRDTEQPTGSTILFTGSLDFRPNIDAVLWFSRMVLPLIREHRPEARFLVVGRQPAPAVQALHNNQSIIVRPDVADVRPSIAAADVYVVPMRMGGGVRLKLLEALAMQAPVVSTKMGAEGVQNLDDHEHLLLADTPSAFAAATLRLLDDPALGKRLGSAGRELVAAYYDWREIVPQLEQVYCSLPV